MRKLAIFSFAFAAGIVTAQYILPASVLLCCAAAVFVLGLLALFLRGDLRLRCILIAAGLCAALCWSRACVEIYWSPAENLDGQTREITVTVTGYSGVTNYGVKAAGKIDSGPKVQLYLNDPEVKLKPGDTIRVEARLRLAAEDGEEYVSFTAKGIFLLAYQAGEAKVQYCAKTPLKYFPAVTAQALKDSIDRAFPEDAAPILKAVITGDKSGIDDETRTLLNHSGLAHTVVVSGMHMSFFVGMITLLLRKKRRAAIFGIPLVLFFMAITGFTPSVVRAGLMSILVLLAPALGREYDAQTALGLSLLILLAVNPYTVKSVSLQLSYGSFAGIMLFSERMDKSFRTRLCSKNRVIDRALKFISGSVSVTLSAMVFSTPLIAVYFGYVVLVAPISNLLCLWALSLIFTLGIFVGAVGIFLPAVAAVAAWAVWIFVKYFLFVASVMGSLPFASVALTNEYIKNWLTAAYAIILVMIFFRGLKGFSYIPVCGIIITLCIALLLGDLESGGLTFIAADVGQGQCLVFRLGDMVGVIDCGGSGSSSEVDTAENLVRSLGGSSELDYLILTHFHSDHAAGAAALIEVLNVKNLIIPQIDDDSDELLAGILAAAGKRGTEVYVLSDAVTIESEKYGDMSVKLFPPLGTKGNEQGLSVLITYDKLDILVTGDMETATELRLIDKYELPDIEVLVAGHHGSGRSSGGDLLDAVTPETVIISVGKNSYGHPADETIERFLSRGMRIYRTDLNGNITLRA